MKYMENCGVTFSTLHYSIFKDLTIWVGLLLIAPGERSRFFRRYDFLCEWFAGFGDRGRESWHF